MNVKEAEVVSSISEKHMVSWKTEVTMMPVVALVTWVVLDV